MMDDEAALLAELKKISAGSASSRFRDETPSETEEPAPMRTTSNSELSQNEINLQTNGNAIKSDEPAIEAAKEIRIAKPADAPFTFQGDRGGTAEDADLLAELMAISNKTSSTNRFASSEDDASDAGGGAREESQRKTVEAPPQQVAAPPKPKTPSRRSDAELPPWKRKAKRQSGTVDVDVVVSGGPPPRETADVEVLAPPGKEKEAPVAETRIGKPAEMPFTFQGERGGAAEDADLLAELMAISNKTSSTNRFASSEDDASDAGGGAHEEPQRKTVEAPPQQVAAPPKPKTPSRRSDAELPPWKRKAKRQSGTVDVDVVVSGGPPPRETADVEVLAPPRKEKEVPLAETRIGKPAEMPFTFQGERGGAAEDADLLAELMAISNKTSSTNRFASSEDDASDAGGGAHEEPQRKTVEAPPQQAAAPPKPKTPSRRSDAELPPWKRKAKRQSGTVDVDVVVSGGPPPRETADVEVLAPPGKEKEAPVAETRISKPAEMPFTFQGERGGAAEDADLLAELMAISNKTSSTNRFASSEDKSDDQDGGTNKEPQRKTVEAPPQQAAAPPKPKTPSRRSDTELPPWKRKAKRQSGTVDVDVVVSGGPPPRETADVEVLAPPRKEKEAPVAETRIGKPAEMPFTFQGERGGAAEDADLLAELMAISNKTSSTNRFASSEDISADQDGGTNEEPQRERVEAPPQQVAAPPKPKTPSRRSDAELPPWKRKAKRQSGTVDVDVVVSGGPPARETADVEVLAPPPKDEEAPVAETRISKPAEMPFTFQGERGGAAEDADLLAELMAISNKTSSTNRFASSEDDASDAGGGAHEEPQRKTVEAPPQQVAAPPKPKTPSRRSDAELPPWKRKAKRQSGTVDVDVVVSGGPPPRETADVEVLAPPRKEKEVPLAETRIGKPAEMPFTFQGERGGAAEDADLLAELMAISNKTSSTNRFASSEDNSDDQDGGTNEEPRRKTVEAPPQQVAAPPKPKTPSRRSDAELPPWKRKAKRQSGTVDVDVVVSGGPPPRETADVEVLAPPRKEKEVPLAETRIGKPAEMPFTFQGERGGAAEDADLLAELMAISNKESKTNRFNSDGSGDDKMSAPSSAPRIQKEEKRADPHAAALKRDNNVSRFSSGSEKVELADHVNSSSQAEPNPFSTAAPRAPAVPPFASQPPPDDVVVTRETLEQSIKDKNWKLRKQSYILLKAVLEDIVANGQTSGTVPANSVLPGLGNTVLGIVVDNNASALDFGLQFAISFAEHCVDATDSEVASSVIASLLKGNGFSSSRGTTVKLAASLASKLMEVGSNGAESVHSVVTVLLEKGLASRKPKIVLAATSAILDAALDFGASTLPLAAVKDNASKMLQHSNAIVRENGIKIVAEICRALGSKAPLQQVLDKLKQAQLSQLNSMLEKQPKTVAPRIGLRSSGSTGSATVSAEEAMAVLESQAKEMEAKRFANRPPANIFTTIPRTDYATRILLPKWSEKVAALDILLECGGEKPYKLEQPGGEVNYASLIGAMKKLLDHTHFAVASKALQVLAMFADGVGEKLFPNLRPLLTNLVQHGKDKKLTKAVAACLDSFFGSVLSLDHLLDDEDALPSQMDERKQKNALVRSSCLEYLGRCIKRNDDAGSRGKLSGQNIKRMGLLAQHKLSDTDAKVRSAATELLKTLMTLEQEEFQTIMASIIEGLKTSNERAYKSLTKNQPASSSTPFKRERQPPLSKSSPDVKPTASPKMPKKSVDIKKATPLKLKPNPAETEKPIKLDNPGKVPELEEALSYLQSLGITNWSAPEDDGGVLSGLNSTKWLNRQRAIQCLTTFCKSNEVLPDGDFSSALLRVTKSKTKEFRDSNINITKSVFELVIAVCDLHAKSLQRFPTWVCKDIVSSATEKLADRKASTNAASVLTELCVVLEPSIVIADSFSALEKVKAPAVHEAFQKWFSKTLVDFGLDGLGLDVAKVVSLLGKECDSTNLNIKKATISTFGELHKQIGPAFRALTLSILSQHSIKAQLEAIFESVPFDPSLKEKERVKRCILIEHGSSSEGNASSAHSLGLAVPRLDLLEEIGPNCMEKMKSKEGKTAWKLRKEAMDEVGTALGNCSGMLLTENGGLKSLVDLLRILKERLSDSQSNLKPVAARLIGEIIGAVDTQSQGTLAKLVLSSLVGAAMNDSRKPMREASLRAIEAGMKGHELDGGEYNELPLEALIVALVGELKQSEFKTAGIPDVLGFVASVAEYVPNVDNIMAARAQPLGEKLASVMVDCLTSSKSETRAACDKLIRAFFDAGKISAASLRKGVEHLKPAQQRTVAPAIQKIVGASTIPTRNEKENLPSKGGRLGGNKASKANASTVSPAGRSSVARLPTAAGTRQTESDKADDLSVSSNVSAHPLSAQSTEKRRHGTKQIHWVDFPEEPAGATLFNALQKAWAHILPKKSQSALFPSCGIKKQDDAKEGCELLERVFEYESKHGGDHVVDQLDFLLKWSAFSLCSRENTVGLQALLSMFVKLINFLGERSYMVSENEALTLFPYILEKASMAKGRFRDAFDDILTLTKDTNVLPTKVMGACVCANTIEKSTNAKARVLAYQACSDAVSQIGLSGIGKRGLLVATKMVSDEALTENRAAALDLISIVLEKMDGDIDRLARLCGASYSDKSRKLIEERWRKRAGTKAAPPRSLTSMQAAPAGNERKSRRSLLPPSRKSTGDRRKALQGLTERSALIDSSSSKPVRQELPQFQLRLGSNDDPGSPISRGAEIVPSLGPFTFSYDTAVPAEDSRQPERPKLEFKPSLPIPAPRKEPNTVVPNTIPTPTGSAASLRARLLKIRQKNLNQPPAPPLPDEQSISKKEPGLGVKVKSVANADQAAPATDLDSPIHSEQTNDFSWAMQEFETLCSNTDKVSESDDIVHSCIAALKRFHATISEKESSSIELGLLRQEISDYISTTVTNLTMVLKFAFDNGIESQNAGMCVPLLSVVLATLMSLFRDTVMARAVSQDALVSLVRETGRCLLDSRLAVSATHVSGLDESTSSQMVRGMNKLAVQAATGSSRHNSLKALMFLEVQLTLHEAGSMAESSFNGRLSRIVMKLFGKVVKAEESARSPYAPDDVNLEILFGAIAELLHAVDAKQSSGPGIRGDPGKACRDMAETLTESILKFRSAGEVRQLLEYIGLGNSLAMELIPEVATEMVQSKGPAPILSPSRSQSTSKDVAELVSNIGSAPEGPERVAAVEVLREYRAQHGDEELTLHLEKVSDTFRAYVWEQLRTASTPKADSGTETEASLPMSARIRKMRSKLNVSDSSGDDGTGLPSTQSPVRSPKTPALDPGFTATTPSRISTPSRIPLSTTPRRDKASTVLSLRQRLAAAQASRTQTSEDSEPVTPSPGVVETGSSSRGHAAALRARLQAVKKQTENN